MAEIPEHVKRLADRAMIETKAYKDKIPDNALASRNFEQSSHPENIASIEKAGQNPDKQITPDKE